MRVTIFGIIWLSILIIVFLNNKAKYIVGMTLLSMVMQQASVVFLGDTGIGPQIFTSVAMIAWSLRTSTIWNDFTLKFSKKNYLKKICFIAIVGFIGVILISRKINYMTYRLTDVDFTLLFIQLLIYILCFLCMWNLKDKVKAEEIETIFVNIILIVVVIGILQVGTQMNVLPLKSIMCTFIYTNPDALNNPWQYPRFFSTFQEPSYCSPFLVGGFYYIISLGNKSKKYMFLAVTLVLAIMLTFSSTAYGTFGICGILYVIISKNKKALKYLVPIGIACVLLLFVSGYLMQILNEVIFQKMSTGSAWTRGNLDDYCYAMYEKAKIWGNGYKNIRGSQFLKSLAAQLGIMGCVFWFLIWTPICAFLIKNRIDSKFVGVLLYLVSVVIAMFIAIPDIDIIVFWGMMYLVAVTLSTEKSDLERGKYEHFNYSSSV